MTTLIEEYKYRRYDVVHSELKHRDKYMYFDVQIIDRDTDEVIFEGRQSAVPTKRSELDKFWEKLIDDYKMERNERLAAKYPIADLDAAIAEVRRHRPNRNSELNQKYLLNKGIIPEYSYIDQKNNRVVTFCPRRNRIVVAVEPYEVLDEE